MFKTFIQDRPIIETKYHFPDQPFNPYRRMAYHGYAYDESTGKSDEAIIALLKELSPVLMPMSSIWKTSTPPPCTPPPS